MPEEGKKADIQIVRADLANLRRAVDRIASEVRNLANFRSEEIHTFTPDLIDLMAPDEDATRVENRLSRLESPDPGDFAPKLLLSQDVFFRPGKVLTITEVDGPPSAHTYTGVYTDSVEPEDEEELEIWLEENAWLKASLSDEGAVTWEPASLSSIGDNAGNIIYNSFAVDQVVQVFFTAVDLQDVEGEPAIVVTQPYGLNTKESPDFMVC